MPMLLRLKGSQLNVSYNTRRDAGTLFVRWPRVSLVPSPERISRNLTIITEPAASVLNYQLLTRLVGAFAVAL